MADHDTGLGVTVHPRDMFDVDWRNEIPCLVINIGKGVSQTFYFFASDLAANNISILDTLADMLRKNGYTVTKESPDAEKIQAYGKALEAVAHPTLATNAANNYMRDHVVPQHIKLSAACEQFATESEV